MLSEVDAQLSEQKFINEDLQKEKDILQERYVSLVKIWRKIEKLREWQ